jgi:SAM-dependent methyltransferase
MTVAETSVFDTPAARDINRARLNHLASLGLLLANRTVLDVGSGPGHLAQFFVARGCEVLCLDGRPQNIETLRRTYAGLRGEVADVESEDLGRFGRFDVVFCYGLLYHTTRPADVLQNLSRACRNLLLLETCVLDAAEATFEIVRDTPAINQGLRGEGCRPSPAFVVDELRKAGLPHVYAPTSRPLHRDFLFRYRNDHTHLRNRGLMRQVFIASREPLHNRTLRPLSSGPRLLEALSPHTPRLALLRFVAKLRSPNWIEPTLPAS